MTLTESHTTSLFYIALRWYTAELRGELRTREMFTTSSPAGSSPPRHGDGRGSWGGPWSVTSSVSVVEVSTRAFGGRKPSDSADYKAPANYKIGISFT
ncbi:hypothetical protein ALC53_05278 [Atta colombica]|uniref:Uncharacterized protein n=1 Tax=Atta colombica TaxID=520822 RepID=A0A195BJC1_9HYME|nr:hypothetical protein ALC53_05278 [Atta colombica]